MPDPIKKVSLHEYARQARLKWLDQFQGWSDEEIARGVISRYPGDADHVEVDTRKLFGRRTDALVEYHSRRNGLDPELVNRVMGRESKGNPKAKSWKGASGLMQLMPDTAKRFGVKNINDPYENIEAGTKYLSFLKDRFKGDLPKMLAGYNAGEGAVEKYGLEKVRRFSNAPDGVSSTTGEYIDHILKGYSGYDKSATTKTPKTQNRSIPQNPTNMQATSVPPSPPSRPKRSVTSALDALTQSVNQMTRKLEAERGQQGSLLELPKQINVRGRQVDTRLLAQRPTRTQGSGQYQDPRDYTAQRRRNTPAFGMRPEQQEVVSNKLDADEISHSIARRKEIENQVKLEFERSEETGFGQLPYAAAAKKEADLRYDQEREHNEWVKKNEPEIAVQTERLRGLIREQGGDPDSWIAEVLHKGTAGLLNLGGGVAKLALAGGPNAQPAQDKLRITAEAALRAAEEEGADRGKLSKWAQGVSAGFISTAPALAAMRFGVPAPAAFGAQAGLESIGRGETAAQTIGHTGKSAAIGAAFEIPVPRNLPNLQLGARKAATVGGATAGIELATGSDPAHALESAATNALLAGGMPLLKGLGETPAGIRRYQENRERPGRIQLSMRAAEADPRVTEGLARSMMPKDLDLNLGRKFGDPSERILPIVQERRSATRVPEEDWLNFTEQEKAATRARLEREVGPPTHEEGVPLPSIIESAKQRQEIRERQKTLGIEERHAGPSGGHFLDEILVKGWDLYKEHFTTKGKPLSFPAFMKQVKETYPFAKERTIQKAYDSIAIEFKPKEVETPPVTPETQIAQEKIAAAAPPPPPKMPEPKVIKQGEPEILHRTLETRTKDAQELYDDVLRRGFDLYAANAKSGNPPPTQEQFSAEMKRVLPRTRKDDALLKDAYETITRETAPTPEGIIPDQPSGRAQPSTPIRMAMEDALSLPYEQRPQAREIVEGETAVREFVNSLKENKLPEGYDTIRWVHHDPVIIKGAMDRVAKEGLIKSDDWVKRVEDPTKEMSDAKIATGSLLLKIYQQQGKTARADDMASYLAVRLSDAGRELRAARFINELSPEGILTQANKDLQRNYKSTTKRFAEKDAAEILDKARGVTLNRARLSSIEKKISEAPAEVVEAAEKKVRSVRTKLTTWADKAEKNARQVIKVRKSNLTLRASIPGLRAIHPDLPELITIGTAKMVKKVVGYDPWAREMVKEFGEDIKPYLSLIYRESGKDLIQRRKDQRHEAEVNRVTKGKPEDFSPDEITELLALEKEVRKQRAADWRELHQRSEFGYPRRETGPREKFETEGPARPDRMALMINELGTGAEANVIIGAMKLMRIAKPNAKQWEREMADERGVDIKNIKETEALFKQSWELLKNAEAEVKLRAAMNKNPTLSQTEVEQLLFDRKVAQKELAKQKRDLAKVYERLTLTTEQKAKARLYEAVTIPKALKASVDMSAPGRQGWVLLSGAGIRGRKIQQEALGMMVQNAMSEQRTDANVSKLENHVRWAQGERNGLHMTSRASVEHAISTLTPREESFVSFAADKIPLVARSNRAYSGYLDAVRLGYFDMFARELESKGLSERTHPHEYKALAEMVNTFTGRGKLKHESLAPALNALLWSPRFVKSRFNVLNPAWYVKQPPEVRKIAVRTALKSLGTTFGLLGLAATAGAGLGMTVNWDNPDDPDWLKIRLGNTRYDLTGGHVPIARFFYKVGKNLNNARKGEYADVTDIQDLAMQLFRGKEAPFPALAHSLYTGKDFKGDKMSDKTPSEIIRDLFVPMIFEDVSEAMEAEGWLGFAKTAVPSFVGVTVSTYEDRGMFALRGTPREELHRLDFDTNEVLGRRTGIKKYDEAYTETITPMIQSRLAMVTQSDIYKRSTDAQKALQLSRELTKIREEARKIAEKKLTPIELRDFKQSRSLSKRERDAGLTSKPKKGFGF